MKLPKYANYLIYTLLGLSAAALIVWVNYQVIGSWFGKNGPANFGSIEVSYVSMGRFLKAFGFSSWAPFWYLGFPFHVFYTPLLPFLEFLLNKMFNLPLWEGYRLITGLGYILAPVSVFLLGWQLSKKFLGGLIAGMLFSVSPSIFYFILKSGEVAADRISQTFWDPRRFTILVRWGEGPHILSMIFTPLAGLFFARLLEKPRFLNLFLCALFVALTGLTNAIGLFSAILLIGSMAFVRLAQAKEDKFRGFTLAVYSGLLALGLISFWYNLSFLSTFFREGGGSGSILLSLFPWGWIVAAAIIGLVYYLIAKFLKNFGFAASLVWFLILFVVVATYYMSAAPDEPYLRIELLPQALRYNAQVDLSLSLLIGVLFGSLLNFVSKKSRIGEVIGSIIGLVMVGAMVIYVQPYFSDSTKAAGNLAPIENTQEQKLSKWLSDHVDDSKAERVVVPGNYGFYLNWFSNVSQLRGALYQASTHHWSEHIYYLLANGKNSDIAHAWLEVINAKYLVVTGPGSPELYKDFKNQDRFDNFPVAEKLGADIIYQVPLKRPSLAKPVKIADLKNLKVPVKADDKERLLAYTDWVDNSSNNETRIQKLNNDSYKIEGKVGQGEGILVQMTADSGWNAKDNIKNSGIRVGKDTLGFVMIYPKAGDVSITLRHSNSWDVYLGYLISVITVGLAFWIGVFKKRLWIKAEHV